MPTGCDRFTGHSFGTPANDQRTLTFLSLSEDGSSNYERRRLIEFGLKEGIAVEYMPTAADTTTSQLDMVKESLKRKSNPSDMVMVDTTWPAVIAKDLIDLGASFPDAASIFTKTQIQNNIVNGRLIALPFTADYSVLWYRPSLLKRYGFGRPPETWSELEVIARAIQAGERKRGHKEFWGYAWAGGASEGLTCHALEWFKSASGHNFVESDGSVWINTPENLAALKRAATWIGSISPRGVAVYHESDVDNLWREGEVAFAGSWINMWKADAKPIGGDDLAFQVTTVPGGQYGHADILGEMGVGISKYSDDKAIAIKAIRYFIGYSAQREMLIDYGVIPTRLDLREGEEARRHTLLRNAAAQRIVQNVVARPSTILGTKYEEVSRDISGSINRVLLGRAEASATLADLQHRVEKAVGSK